MKNICKLNLFFLIAVMTISTVIYGDTDIAISDPSNAFALNAGIENQPFFFQDSEPIYYSGKFQSYDETSAKTLRVTETTDDVTTVLKEATPADAGSFELRPADYSIGYHLLKHEILDASGKVLASMQKGFTILDMEKVEFHVGQLSNSETWSTNKVHIIYESFLIPSGRSLTISYGAIVKFCTGASIDIASGSSCIANGTIFTHINDDTVGGDTLNDGIKTSPMDAYAIKGDLTYNDETAFRFLTEQQIELSGTISQNTKLNKNKTYCVSNVTINGCTLTIPAGTILKMNSGASITVNSDATLSAIGTRAAPIIITSIKDDSYNGDTNADGDASYPYAGDWGTINCSGGNIKMEYVSVLYGGDSSDVFNMTGGSILFNNSILAHAYQYGVALESGSWTMSNSIFFDFHTAFRHFASCNCINSVFYGMTYLSNNGGQTFKNCIISNFDTALCWWSDNCTYNNCVIWNPSGFGPQSSDKAGTNDNIWGDPLLIDPENYDFRILENSPCIDAADSDVAPEFDYYGQPRVTITPGHSGSKPAADIGIFEVMPDDVKGDIDLIPVIINCDTNATPGKTISLEWQVKNEGINQINGSWRDTISLVNSFGQEIQIGERLTTSIIPSGATLNCSGSFVVPALDEGYWYPKVNVNSYHDIFEGSLSSNNCLIGNQSVNVTLDSVDPNVPGEGTIEPGIPTFVKFKYGDDSTNRMVKLTVPIGAKVIWGFGFMPKDTSSSGFVTAGDKEIFFLVPEEVSDVYIIIESENGGNYKFSVTSENIAISGVSPLLVPSSGMTTVKIFGAGFGETNIVTFFNSTKKHKIQTVKKDQNNNLVVMINCSELVPGDYYGLDVESDGNLVRLENAIFVEAIKGEGQFWAKVIAPDSVRQGRKVTCYIEFGNSGNADVPAQILQINVTGGGLLEYVDNIQKFNAIHFVAASNANGKISPGDSFKIPFTLLAGPDNRLSFFSTQPDNEDEFCSAVSRVYALGEDITDFRLAINELSTETSLDLNTYKKYKDYFNDIDSGSKLDVSIVGLNCNDISVVAKNIFTGKKYTPYLINDSIASFYGLQAGAYIITAESNNEIGSKHVLISSLYETISLELTANLLITGFIQNPCEEDLIVFFSEDNAYFTDVNYDGSYSLKISPNTYDISVISLSNNFSDLTGVEINTNTNINFIVGNTSHTSFLDFTNQLDSNILINKVGVITDYNDRWYESKYTCAQKRATEGRRLVSLGWSYLRQMGKPTGELDCIHNRAIYNENYRTIKMFSIKLDTYVKNISMVDWTKPAAYLSKLTHDAANRYLDVYIGNRKAKLVKRYGAWAGGRHYAKNLLVNTATGVYKDAIESLIFKMDEADEKLDRYMQAIDNNDIDTIYKALEEYKESVDYAGYIYDLLQAKHILDQEVIYKLNEHWFGQCISFVDFALDYLELAHSAYNAGDSAGEWAYARWNINEWMQDFEREIIFFSYQLPLKPYIEHCCDMQDDEDISDSQPVQICHPNIPYSYDPNEMTGPFGVGDYETQRFILPGEWLTYTVYFENKSNATAAAQEVYVTNELNKWLDWSTFEMGEIVYNNQVDLGLAGAHAGTCETAASGTNYNVRTSLEFDDKAGRAKWYMRIVDPTTDTGWPEDVLIGFLPPNDETYRGEGHLTYRVKLREDAPAGVRINNSATIVFDYNEPIETDPAWWNIVAQLKTISFDSGDDDVTLIVGLPFGELPTIGDREGWTFVGWFTGPNGTGRHITSDSLVEEGDDKLYAYWTANAYTVNYHANGGEGTMESQNVTYGMVFNLSSNKFFNASYRYAGWAKSETGDVVYGDGATVSNLTAIAGGEVDLFAVWRLWTIQISIDVDGTETNLNLVVGQPYGELPKPTERKGWTFVGWFTGPEGTGRCITSDTTVGDGDEKLYAYWTVNTYTVNYLANGGDGEMESQDVTYGMVFNLLSNMFTRAKYRYVGWGTNETGNVVYNDGATVSNLTDVAGGEVDLYAVWKSMNVQIRVIIDGTETNLNLVIGQAYGKLPTPAERKGWIFVGWFTGPDGTGRLITEDSLVEEGDTALYQYWVRDWHDLNKDDETNAVSDTYDGYIYDVDTHDIKGSIKIKVGMPKNGSAKVTGTVILVGGTKSDIMATMIMSDTKIDTKLKNGSPLKLVLSSNGMMGTLDKWEISGVRNLFLSKAPGDQAIAEVALNQMQGVYTVAWEEGAGYVFASIAIGKKGKAKATGCMANGTKFSATGQLLIGKEEHCVNLVSKSSKTPVGFNLWFAADKSLETEGTQGTSVAGKLGALGTHSFFTCDYLTEPIPVDVIGNKWSVTASKLLAFKLSYKDTAGSFKGSFKIGKEKATVNGVVVEGIGYGTAMTKSLGAKAVIIKEINE